MSEVCHVNDDDFLIIRFRKRMLSVFLIHNALYFFINTNLINNNSYSKWHIAIIGLHLLLIGSFLYLFPKFHKDLTQTKTAELLDLNFITMLLFIVYAIAQSPQLVGISINMSAYLPIVLGAMATVVIIRLYVVKKTLISKKEFKFNLVFHGILMFLMFMLHQYVLYFVLLKIAHYTYYHCKAVENIDSRLSKSTYYLFQLLANVILLSLFKKFNQDFAIVYCVSQLGVIYFLHVHQKQPLRSI